MGETILSLRVSKETTCGVNMFCKRKLSLGSHAANCGNSHIPLLNLFVRTLARDETTDDLRACLIGIEYWPESSSV